MRLFLTLAHFPTLPACPPALEGDRPGECSDRADNDRDGCFDCHDPDCAAGPDCSRDEDDDAAGDADQDATGDEDDSTM